MKHVWKDNYTGKVDTKMQTYTLEEITSLPNVIKSVPKNAFLLFLDRIHLYLAETNLLICENVSYKPIN